MASLSALVFEELGFSEIREVIEFLFAQAERCIIVLVLDGGISWRCKWQERGRSRRRSCDEAAMRRCGDAAHNMRRSHAGLPAKSRIVLDTIKYS